MKYRITASCLAALAATIMFIPAAVQGGWAGNAMQAQKGDDHSDVDEDLPGQSLAFEWSANGFVEIDSALKWKGNGGEMPSFSYAIPETDAFFWVTECKNGEAWNYIQLAESDDKIGTRSFLKFETDKSDITGYYADIVALPFGDGGPEDPSLLLKLPTGDPLLNELAKGNWLYVQRGEGDSAVKRRLSLAGSAKAIAAFRSGCRTSGSARGSAGAVPPLSLYNGKYPFDEIDGYRIITHPLYQAGVKSVVSNATHLRWAMSDEVVAGPISFANGKASVSACEPHNCGNRNWTVMIEELSGRTEVCFNDSQAEAGQQALRYTVAGVRPMDIEEDCDG